MAKKDKVYEKRPLTLHMTQWDADDVLDTLMDVAIREIDDIATRQYTTWTDNELEHMAGAGSQWPLSGTNLSPTMLSSSCERSPAMNHRPMSQHPDLTGQPNHESGDSIYLRSLLLLHTM